MDPTQLPSAVLTFAVFGFAAALAALANYLADRLGWIARYRSPWRRFPKSIRDQGTAPKRIWADYVPIAGWFFLARLGRVASQGDKNNDTKDRNNRKSSSTKTADAGTKKPFIRIPGLESSCFWIRPLLVELLFAALVTLRFHCLTFDPEWGALEQTDVLISWGIETLLFFLCLCASLVDLDDYVIPDMIMLPGFCLGLILQTVSLGSTVGLTSWPLDLSGKDSTFNVCEFAANLLANLGSTNTWNSVRASVGGSLTLLWTLWSFALLDRRFYLRLGLKRAFTLFWRRLSQSPLTPVVGFIWAIGLIGIWFVVLRSASAACTRPLSGAICSLDALAASFVGLTVGAGMIWAVRIVGRLALGVEAMGLGDVILAGTIGSFIGWQGAVVVFFVAPFFGLIFGLLRRCFNTESQIPYGPFLCLGTLVYVVWRERFLTTLGAYFGDPLFLLGIGVVGFVLLTVMLFALRLIKRMNRG